MTEKPKRLKSAQIRVGTAFDKSMDAPVVLVDFAETEFMLVLPTEDAVTLAKMLTEMAQRAVQQWEPITKVEKLL